MKKVHLVPVGVFLVILLYFILRGRPLDGGTFSNSFAIAATLVIGICFLLGPLSRLKPRLVTGLKYRKPLGLWGFLFAAIHTAAALTINFDTITSTENLYSMMSGIIAFIIFALMAFTSTGKAITKMGYAKWKRLQRTGYIAFFFVLLHFTIVNNGAFVSRQLGQFLMTFVLLVLLVRILAILLGKKEAYKPKEFHEVHEIEASS